MKNLDEIEIGGGGDCPEMSLTALHDGINRGLSNSVVYVITDATAKDHIKYKKTVNLLKNKGSTVSECTKALQQI